VVAKSAAALRWNSAVSTNLVRSAYQSALRGERETVSSSERLGEHSMSAGDGAIAQIGEELPVLPPVFTRLGIIGDDARGGREAAGEPRLEGQPESAMGERIEPSGSDHFPHANRRVLVVIEPPNAGDLVMAHALPDRGAAGGIPDVGEQDVGLARDLMLDAVVLEGIEFAPPHGRGRSRFAP